MRGRVVGRNEVALAFDIVLEEIENAIAALDRDGAQFCRSGKYDEVKDITGKVLQMTAFRDRVIDLQGEWSDAFPATYGKEPDDGPDPVLRTPGDEFRIPILRALETLGGRATMGRVLDKVEGLMKDRLNERDRQPLPSDPDRTSWHNTAQWERYKMVKQGLLSANSPRGVWEITLEGKRWLADAEKKQR
ncbi:MAG TPA: hypothetical protein DEQ28_01500 [Clostridiales bacterium]|nr:hypothetical protein [Clostridiales bacterium]